ncbi:MAG: hypothetical protein AAF730_16875 [Bacteroidota bacterium]
MADTEGHTLLEVAVAIALFVTVAAPLGASVVYLQYERRVARDIQALAVAEAELEVALATRVGAGRSYWLEDRTWRVQLSVEHVDARIAYNVEVYHRRAITPIVTLRTLRWYPSATL